MALLTACSNEAPATPDATAAPAMHVVRDAPSELLLRLRDLPAGYTIEEDASTTLESFANAAGGSDRGVLRDGMLKAGFVSGHGRAFVHDAPTAEATRIFRVYLYIYKDGATTSEIFKKNTSSPNEVTVGETIGDEVKAFEIKSIMSDKIKLTDYVVTVRYGNSIVTADMQGLTSVVKITEAIDFAKRQVQVLRADAEGQRLPSPTPRASLLSGALPDMVLSFGDLPDGYTSQYSGALNTADLVRQMASAEAATRFLQSVGLRNAYGRSFTKQAKDRPITVGSVVLLHADSGAGERAFSEWVKFGFLQGGHEISIGERIGDESMGRELKGYAPGALGDEQEVTWVTVYWRYGDAVSWVKLESISGTVDATLAADLARKQFERQRSR